MAKLPAIRELAIKHINDGKKPKEISNMLKISTRTVFRWAKDFRETGVTFIFIYFYAN